MWSSAPRPAQLEPRAGISNPGDAAAHRAACEPAIRAPLVPCGGRLLDALFEAAAEADEPEERNYLRKHALALRAKGAERPASRLFCNPAGDYGSMVNERVGSGEWDESSSLGDTWASRNAFSYGRGDKGSNRADVLQSLLATTERVVQEIDSVECKRAVSCARSTRLCLTDFFPRRRPNGYTRILREHGRSEGGR